MLLKLSSLRKTVATVVLITGLVSSEVRCTFALTVNIISPGMINFEAINSLNSIGPALDTGLQVLQQKYPNQTWRNLQLADGTISRPSTCAALIENIQPLVARWYYREGSGEGLNVIVAPGKDGSSLRISGLADMNMVEN